MSADKEMLKKYIINIVRLNDYLDKTISIIKAKKSDLNTLKIISETSEEFFSKVEDLSTEDEEEEEEDEDGEEEEEDGEEEDDEEKDKKPNFLDDSEDKLAKQFKELEDLVKQNTTTNTKDNLACDFLNNSISYLKKKEYKDFYASCAYY